MTSTTRTVRIARKPWSLMPGDVLADGREVARVTILNGRFMVIMRNGPALSGDGSHPSVTVARTVRRIP